jgi:hypothetical protein
MIKYFRFTRDKNILGGRYEKNKADMPFINCNFIDDRSVRVYEFKLFRKTRMTIGRLITALNLI